MSDKLLFTLPGEDDPGYLEREYKRIEFLKKQEEIEDPVAKLDALVDYLAGFIDEPKDKKQAKALLRQASKKTFTQLSAHFVFGMTADKDKVLVSNEEKGG